ncbi:hypothetical protein RB195_008421 [Necator americanus]
MSPVMAVFAFLLFSISSFVTAQPGPPVSTSCDTTICGHGTRCQMVELSTCHDDVCPLVPRCIQVLCDTSCNFCPPDLKCVLVDTGCCPNPQCRTPTTSAPLTTTTLPGCT